MHLLTRVYGRYIYIYEKLQSVREPYHHTLNTVSQQSKLKLQPITVVLALRSDCQGLTLPPILTPTVDTTYCDVVFIACHESS